MYCPKCYQKIGEENKFCPNCGGSFGALNEVTLPEPTGGNFWFGVLSFFEPIVGFIFFLVWRKKRKRRAKVCGINALVSALLALLYGAVVGMSLWKEISKYIIPCLDNKLMVAEYGTGTEIYYDEATNGLIVQEEKRVTVYECNLEKVWFTYSYEEKIASADAYNGVLAVGFSDEILLYDLFSGEIANTVTACVEVGKILMTNGKLVYCDGDQWCEIWVYDFDTKEQTKVKFLYEPDMAINHGEQILYAVERNNSSCNLYYVNLHSLKVSESLTKYAYNKNGVYFDGRYVHAFGCTFNERTGELLSGREVYVAPVDENAGLYKRVVGYMSFYALLEKEDGKTAIYNIGKEKEVGYLKISAVKAYALSDGGVLLICQDGKTATLDARTIEEVLR